MDTIQNLLTEYWWIAAIMLAIRVLNALTKHYSEHKGLVKFCLFLLDIFDFLKGIFNISPSPTRYIALLEKQLNNSKPNKDADVIKAKSDMAGPLILLLCFMPLIGCATFQDKVKLVQAKVSSFATAANKEFHEACTKAISVCKLKQLKECEEWLKCDETRSKVDTSVAAIEKLLADINEAYKKIKGGK